MYRAVRTTQECRMTGKRHFIDIDGYRIKIRPRRNAANLPNSWDDVCRNDWNHRTWKRHRKTQYKTKAA